MYMLPDILSAIAYLHPLRMTSPTGTGFLSSVVSITALNMTMINVTIT